MASPGALAAAVAVLAACCGAAFEPGDAAQGESLGGATCTRRRTPRRPDPPPPSPPANHSRPPHRPTLAAPPPALDVDTLDGGHLSVRPAPGAAHLPLLVVVLDQADAASVHAWRATSSLDALLLRSPPNATYLFLTYSGGRVWFEEGGASLSTHTLSCLATPAPPPPHTQTQTPPELRAPMPTGCGASCCSEPQSWGWGGGVWLASSRPCTLLPARCSSRRPGCMRCWPTGAPPAAW